MIKYFVSMEVNIVEVERPVILTLIVCTYEPVSAYNLDEFEEKCKDDLVKLYHKITILTSRLLSFSIMENKG